MAAGLAGQQEPDDEGAVLLEEEDVPRLLLVQVAAEDAEGGLVVAGDVGRQPAPERPRRAAASSMNRAMSSSRKVSVSLTCVPIESDQVPLADAPRDDEALHDESVRASTSRTSFMPRWSRNAPMDRKTSSKSWRGLPS